MLAFNPVVTTLPRDGGLLCFAVALAFEIFVILVLLRGQPIRQRTLVLFLVPLNLLTWTLLTVTYEALARSRPGEALFILVAEIAVVVVEAAALLWFSVLEARSTARARASKRRIVRAVVLGNLVSFGVGLVVTPPFVMSPATARLHAADNEVRALGLACVRFWLHERRLPESCAELIPRYLDVDDVPFDPWGTPYEIEVGQAARLGTRGRTSHELCVISSGADREFGTEDDIVGRFELK